MHEIIENAKILVREDARLDALPIKVKDIFSGFILNNNYNGINTLLRIVLPDNKKNDTLLYLQSLCYFLGNDINEAEKSIEAALEIVIKTNDVDRRAVFENFCQQIKYSKSQIAAEIPITNNDTGKIPEPNIETTKDEVEFLTRDLTTNKDNFEKRQAAIEKGIPSILLISSARSASTLITTQMGAFLGCPRVNVDAQPVPLEHDVAVGMLQDFVRGGAMSYVHSRANKKNLDALKNSGLTKFILHVRDPRQSLLSNYYRMHAMGDWRYRRIYYNELPLEYDEMSFEEQLDWQIDNIYEHYWVDWIEEWQEIALNKNSTFDIKLTTYENFVERPVPFYLELGNFYGIELPNIVEDELLASNVEPKTEVNGKIDYWREKLTPQQIERIQSLTPDRLLSSFGWTR